MDKIKVIIVRHNSDKLECAFTEEFGILDGMSDECKVLLEEGGEGDSITFKLAYMTQEQLDKMEEFRGW